MSSDVVCDGGLYPSRQFSSEVVSLYLSGDCRDLSLDRCCDETLEVRERESHCCRGRSLGSCGKYGRFDFEPIK